MSSTTEHRIEAERGLVQLEARLERLRENVAGGALGYAEGELACRLLELEARVVAVHATLAVSR